MRYCLWITVLGLVIASCESKSPVIALEGGAPLQIDMVTVNDSSHILRAFAGKTEQLTGEWKLPYPVYHWEVADVDENGNDDILVGVIKSTRHDSVKRKRLFIFQLQDGGIIPLWLGSRMGRPLEDFRSVQVEDKNTVRTIEWDRDSTQLVAEYHWRGFGFEFSRYLGRELNSKDARTLFNQP